MRRWDLIFMLCLAFIVQGSAFASSKETSSAVMLEIQEGDTAFLIDRTRHEAWWIVGECRRSIPLEPVSNASKPLMSRLISETVTLGSRQIRLRQQFRFDLASDPVSVSVYSSVRSGWSPVPVKREDACADLPICRARMELPEC